MEAPSIHLPDPRANADHQPIGVRIRNVLLERIVAGHYRPGVVLPADRRSSAALPSLTAPCPSCRIPVERRWS